VTDLFNYSVTVFLFDKSSYRSISRIRPTPIFRKDSPWVGYWYLLHWCHSRCEANRLENLEYSDGERALCILRQPKLASDLWYSDSEANVQTVLSLSLVTRVRT